DQLPAEDLGSEQPVAAQADQTATGDGPVHLDGLAVFDGWQWGRPGGNATGGRELGQVIDRQVRAQGLDPGAAGGQMDQVGVSPESDHCPGPGGAEPELPPGYPHVPRRGNDPVELDRPTVPWRTPGGNLGAVRRPGAGSRRSGRLSIDRAGAVQ